MVTTTGWDILTETSPNKGGKALILPLMWGAGARHPEAGETELNGRKSLMPLRPGAQWRRSEPSLADRTAAAIADLGEGPDLSIRRGVAAQHQVVARVDEHEIAGYSSSIQAVQPGAHDLAGAVGQKGLAGAFGDGERVLLRHRDLAFIHRRLDVDVDRRRRLAANRRSSCYRRDMPLDVGIAEPQRFASASVSQTRLPPRPSSTAATNSTGWEELAVVQAWTAEAWRSVVAEKAEPRSDACPEDQRGKDRTKREIGELHDFASF